MTHPFLRRRRRRPQELLAALHSQKRGAEELSTALREKTAQVLSPNTPCYTIT